MTSGAARPCARTRSSARLERVWSGETARRWARPLQWAGMAHRPPLPPGPFLIVGLARSGLGAGRALSALGERVSGCDSGPADAAVLAELEAAGIAVHASTDGVDLLDGIATVVKSPGVPQEAPVVRAARERGLP